MIRVPLSRTLASVQQGFVTRGAPSVFTRATRFAPLAVRTSSHCARRCVSYTPSVSMSKVEEEVAAAAATATTPAGPPPGNASWQQTMLRVKDPKVEVPFWETNFGFKLVARLDFPQWKFSLYFMGTVPAGITLPEDPASEEAVALLWKWPGVLLELTHNHGTEDVEENPYVSGNVEPHRGFGHVAVMCKDVYAACEVLEKNGVKFQKRPDEGRMKGLAFALSPTGYWIEVINGEVEGFTLAQTMIRVKDPAKSVAFYRDHFGMSLVAEKHFPAAKFSLYFMATIPEGVAPPKDPKLDGGPWMKQWDGCVLELTHNHGTETDPEFSYWNGNGPTKKGFGHIGFLVDDVYKHSERLEKAGVPFHKKPDEGGMKGLAFALDPDMYWVEIIKRTK